MGNCLSEKGSDGKGGKAAKALRIVGMVFIGLVFVVLFALVFGFLVKWIWNLLMPEIFGLKEIGYWQAFGMVVLAKLLFGAFGTHHGDRRSHWGRHSRPFSDWHGRSRRNDDGPWNGNNRYRDDYRKYWEREGKAAFEEYMRKRSSGEA